VLIWLSTVIFVNQLGFGSIIPVQALYAKSFGVSQSAIGLSIAVYGLSRFLVNVPAGRLADRIGRRWTLVLGEVVTGVGNILCGTAGSFELFLLFRFMAGAGGAIMQTTGSIILADISTKANRGRTIAVYHGIFLFAVGVGPLPGGLLAEHVGLNAPFYAFGALGLLAAVLAFDKVPETKGQSERTPLAPGAALEPLSLSFGKQLRVLFSQVGFVLVSLVSFIQFFSRTGGIFGVVPLLGAMKLGLRADEIGVGLTLVSVANLGVVQISGMLADRFGRKAVLVPASFLTALSFSAFAVAPGFGWFVASLALWGIAAGISGPAPSAYAADVAPRGMNAVTMSCYMMVADLGYVVGPLLMGLWSDLYGIEAALFATSAIYLFVATLFALFAPETAPRRRSKGASAAANAGAVASEGIGLSREGR